MKRKYRSAGFVLIWIIQVALLAAGGCGTGRDNGPAAQIIGDTMLLGLQHIPGEDRLKQLVSMTAEGDKVVTAELAKAYAYEPAPDGKTVALVGDDGIYLTDLGSGRTVRISELSPKYDLNSGRERPVGKVMAWSPDGSRLAFVCGGDLYMVEAGAGHTPVLVARRTADILKTAEGSPALAPRIEGIICPAWTDNENIIYQDFYRRYDGRWQEFCNIVKINTRTRRKSVIVSGGQEPLLAPDRTRILYCQEENTGVRVKVAGIDGGGAVTLAPLTDRDGVLQHYAWSPDGRYAVFARFAVDTRTGRRIIYAGAPGTGDSGAPMGALTGPGVFSPDGRWMLMAADGGPLLLKCAAGRFCFDSSGASAAFAGLTDISWINR